jgi:hypothetical protein
MFEWLFMLDTSLSFQSKALIELNLEVLEAAAGKDDGMGTRAVPFRELLQERLPPVEEEGIL